ncbi:MAG: transglycosylase SLT domain-containing protein [Saprospiraceae bacterium]|nr:transglycosylase SLT domain-containing protein [Saprospiraceae bacterium]
MKFSWTMGFLLATNLSFGYNSHSHNSKSAFDMEAIQDRIEDMDLPFGVQYNFRVEKHLKDYLVYGQKQSAYILKRSQMYFPIFEHYLALNDMPDILKYLPIVESRMNPTEFSEAGAKGLWQLIPATARENGLIVNDEIDERMDPYKSTEAAVKFLKRLYDRYEDWSLVLAAYNCGPGVVNKAIRKTGACGDFWSVQNYLPGQTKNYIPKFIAASYMAEFYLFHNIKPKALDYDLQFTSALRVFNTVSLSKLSKISGVPMSTIIKLNPSYVKGYIPRTSVGSYLVLPKMAMIRLTDYLKWSEDDSIKTDWNYLVSDIEPLLKGDEIMMYLTLSDTEDLQHLANELKISVQSIKKWNKMRLNYAYPGQKILVVLNKDIAIPNGKRA